MGFSLLAAKLDRKLYPMNLELSKQACHPSLLNSHKCTSFPSALPLRPSTHHPISIDAAKNTHSQPTHALDAPTPQLKAKYLGRGSYLRESNILALLPKALPTDIEAVFPDQTRFVRADATVT